MPKRKRLLRDAGRPTVWRSAVARLGQSRVLRVLFAATAGTLLGVMILLAPDLYGAVPFEVIYTIKHPLFELAALVGLTSFAVAGRPEVVLKRIAGVLAVPAGAALRHRLVVGLLGRARGAFEATPLGRPGRADHFCEQTLRRLLPAAYAVGCVYLLATWVPHYLTWPWWADTEQFAVSALSWHAGIMPYRDLEDFDFPGPIYVHYVLGWLFGWGKTVPFNAADAAALALLGVALAFWSRAVLGGALPGLVAYAAFLGYYMSLNYAMVAQRDWHAPLLAVGGILALEALPGRTGRVLSALALAAALAYRPQPVVFLPAMISAIDEGARRPGEPFVRSVRPLLEWGALLTAGLALAFSPLLLNGIMDDFIRRLRVVRFGGGSYNKSTWSSFSGVLLTELSDRANTRPLFAALIPAAAGPAWLRGPARTWLLAMIGVLFYKPMSPVVSLGYLEQPLLLIRSAALALPIAWLLTTPLLVPRARLVAVAVTLVFLMPYHPMYCSFALSREMLGPLSRGQDPDHVPAGAGGSFDNEDPRYEHYKWRDYRDTLAYVRRSISPRTRVANLLRDLPFPPINGPTGRLSVFSAAGGIIHLWSVDPSVKGRYVELLEGTTDSVVVWNPGTKHSIAWLAFPEMEEVIRRRFRPEARFGAIEVWRHQATD